MQMVKKIIGAIIGSFIILLIIITLAPKDELYYKLERELEKKGVVIGNEKFTTNLLGVKIEDANIYLKGVNIAHIKSINLDIFLIYDRLTIDGVTTDKSIHNFVPKSIDHAEAIFSILKPYKISIDANGSFGEIVGGLYFNMNKLFIRVPKPKDISAFRGFLKRDAKGLYYEKFFK